MNKKLHILFLCGWYPCRVLPTNGDFIMRHAQTVATQHKVSVLHIISDKNAIKDIEITKKTTGNLTEHIAYVKVCESIKKAFLFWRAYKLLLKEIGSFDVVHLHEIFPFGMFALHQKWFKKKPFIISEHWTGYLPSQSENLGFLHRKIAKITTKNAAFVCPVSEFLQKSMQQLDFKGNYKTVPNVVDTGLFFPAKAETPIFNILHVSNMKDEQKNVSGILTVVKKLQDGIDSFKITLIGENALSYQKKAKNLGIENDKIEFIDQVSQKELVTFYQKADVLVLFSQVETQSCVILEAIACGTPVISTNLKAIAEYFSDDFGILIPKNNEDLLLQELLNFYDKKYSYQPSKMHDFIEANYSIQKICEQFTNLYQKAIANH